MVFFILVSLAYIATMFIRQVKKKNSATGKTFFQYQLCQTSRVGGKVKQYSILYLGSEPLLGSPDNRKLMARLMKEKISGQTIIFGNYPADVVSLASEYHEKFLVKYRDVDIRDVMSIPPVEASSHMEKVSMDSLEIEDARTFGAEHLCRQVLEKLKFSEMLDSLGFSGKEANLAHISLVSRALFASSEHKTSQYLATGSELSSLYGYSGAISHKMLYKAADRLYRHRDTIDRLLYARICDMFSLRDSLVIYDLSNTYFEGRKQASRIAKHGRSKEKRNDCRQVVFTGVINAEGFIRYSRIYDGNTADVTTLKDMVGDLRRHSGEPAGKTVVMDAGFASEENLAYLSSEKLRYVCVSRHRIRDYPAHKQGQGYRMHDKRGNPIELSLFKPDGFTDTWMYVKSGQKRAKEQSC